MAICPNAAAAESIKQLTKKSKCANEKVIPVVSSPWYASAGKKQGLSTESAVGGPTH